MGRFSNFLKQRNPLTGRVVRESGDLYNTADAARLREQADVDRASRLGNLYRGFWQGTVPFGTTTEFAIDIPAGLDLFGFTRISTAKTASLYSTFLSCTGFVSAEGPIDGLSFDRRIGKKSVSQCKIHRVSSLSGALLHSPEAELFVPTTGSVRAPSSQTEAGAQPAFDINELPAFRYENKSADTDALLALYLFWQELPTET